MNMLGAVANLNDMALETKILTVVGIEVGILKSFLAFPYIKKTRPGRFHLKSSTIVL